MKKSQFILVKRLKEKLHEFPNIVSSLETKDPNFIEQIFVWSKSVEDIFSTNNISEVSEMAGFRSKILNAKFGDNGGASSKKNQIKTAAGILYDIQNTVLNVLMPYEQKMNECTEIIRQLLAITVQTEALKYRKEMDFESFVQKVWQYILSDSNLKPGAIRMKSMLSEMDVTMLIAHEIELEDFS